MKEKTLCIDDHTIAYYDINEHQDATVVFIHGNSLSKGYFIDILKASKLKEYRLIALDLIGHGNSSKANNSASEYTMLFLSQVLKQFILSLNLKNIILVGHSFGGHLAIEFSGECSGLLKGLIAVGTPPLALPPDMSEAFHDNQVVATIFTDEISESEINNLAINISTSKSSDIANFIKVSDGVFRESIGRSIGVGEYKDEIEILNNSKIPYSLVMGREDRLCRPSYFVKYPFLNQWNGNTQIIENGTHSPIIDNKEPFLNILLSFLKDI